jgi:hypothetical protein
MRRKPYPMTPSSHGNPPITALWCQSAPPGTRANCSVPVCRVTPPLSRGIEPAATAFRGAPL